MAAARAYTTLEVSRPSEHVALVELNRPRKRNAMNRAMWAEIRSAFESLGADGSVRAIVVAGRGLSFSAGLDLSDHMDVFGGGDGGGGGAEGADGADDVGRKALRLRKFILSYQEALSAIERCPQPVVAAVHGACVGGGVDLVCACDIRVAAADAYFCIKEVDIGLAADVGVLQRLARQVGSESLVRELAYTARRMPAQEAARAGFVSADVRADRAAAVEAAVALATEIASKSPIAVVGTKEMLVYARDHTVDEGLRYVASWNAAMLQSSDVTAAAMASMTKQKPVFSKL